MKAKILVVLSLLSTSVAFAGTEIQLKAGTIQTAITGNKHLSQVASTLAQMGDAAVDTGLYLVQWKSAITDEQKQAVAAKGFQLISYLPEDTFLVRGNLATAQAVNNLNFVQAVVPYHAGLKVEPELNRNGVFSFADSVDLSIQTVDAVDAKALQSEFPDLKQIAKQYFVAHTSLSNVWKLAARPEVLWIERYLPMQDMDMKLLDDTAEVSPAATPPAYTGYESGVKVMNADSAYNKGFAGDGMLIAYGDTGLDTGDLKTLIPDFQGQVKSAFAMGVGGTSWADPMSHGTHVAGSIAGNGKSSDGRIHGAAFHGKLVVEGLWSDLLNNLGIPGIPQLFSKAYSEGARIHSNSWGAPNSNGRYDNFAIQADTYIFNNPDFLAVFAAGNDGQDANQDGVIDENSVSSPGSAKNVLTVGASKNLLLEGGIQKQMKDLRNGATKWGVEPLASSRLSEDPRGLAAFSSRGPTADGRLKPEVVAPGTNIVSARTTNPKADPVKDSWGEYDAHYVYMGGTSMATPLTSGAMAVIRQYLVKKMGSEKVSAALMKATISNTAEDLFPGQFGELAKGQEEPTRRPNNHEGWGRVNLNNIFADSAPNIQLLDEKAGLATGKSKSIQIQVNDTSKALRITMAYTDAPGTASAAKALVNDLDLEVKAPNGTIYYPNGMSGKDATNNMEQVDVLNPVAGTYQVTVKGANVPSGKNGAQPYALVVSGGF